MAEHRKPWYLRPLSRWSVFRSVPLSRFWVLLMAGFLLFSIGGFYSDLLNNGTRPYFIVLMIAAYTGLNACLWIIAIARFPAVLVGGVIILQFFNTRIMSTLADWVTSHFALRPVASELGIHFAARSMFVASILSYVFFLRYIVHEGKHSIRLQNELELAQAMQRTLVPPIQLSTPRFEIYGISKPSETVGGDLVDTIHLPGGDCISYLADIAGHGLPASILMGRLKTAIRMSLLDAADHNPCTTLPLLLDRLNTVLPQVKEPNAYATFTGFRLGADGTVFYAMAASPPILHWKAQSQEIAHLQEPQLPLGLIPGSAFDGHTLAIAPGDLLLVVTDGVLEVSNKQQDEFGIDRLKHLIATSAQEPLPQLANTILASVHSFGTQFDDQTLLLVRCS